MTLPDPNTILLMSALMAGALSMVLYSAHLNFPKEIRGLREWALALVLLVGGVQLSAFHGKSDLLLLLANIMMVWGLGMTVIGTERFYALRPSWRLYHAAWILTGILLGYFMWVRPDFIIRVIISSIIVFTLHARVIYAVLRNGERHFSTLFFLSLVIAEAVIVATRGIFALIGGADVNLLGSGVFAALYLAAAHFMTLMMAVGFMTICTRRLQITLERRSMLDPLTLTLNRRGFADIYAKEHALMRRTGVLMTMLNIDIDYFKKINDAHGHAVGDCVLVDMAQVIAQAVRTPGHIARFGGEEFVVLLPATGLERALQISEHIQLALRAPRPDLPSYTVSIGLACQRSADESLDSILHRADQALYCAKGNGRDRCEIAAGEGGSPLHAAAMA